VRSVSEGAIIARVNRVLAKNDQVIRKARPAHTVELGQYYGQSVQTGLILEKDVDLQVLARELGVLRATEAVAA
jgi:hypothetical protein